MPSSKTIDLDAWSNFLPQERSNDHEYNLLLYKYKSLYNEVKDFHELHNDCSVTRANSNRDFSQTHVDNSTSLPPQINSSSSSNGQQVQNKRALFQVQNSVPIDSNFLRNKEYFARRDLRSNLNSSAQNQPSNASVPQYNSSYNLSSLAGSNNSFSNNIGSNKPEIRQRNQISAIRMLLSKSSEKLDTINNNHLPSVSSQIKNEFNSYKHQNNNFVTPVARDSRFLKNDVNIYDAVSPDDTPITNTSNITTFDVAASIHNLNRLSADRQAKLDSSKSFLDLGANNELSKKNSHSSKPVSSTKSTPSNGNNDTGRSNNSFGSSSLLDATNHSNSSLSLLHSLPNRNNSPDYANYVNLEFFYKKRNSPSLDGLDEDTTNEVSSDDSDDDTTQLSQSLSIDHICEDGLRNISPHKLAKKLSIRGNQNSSSSVTPASSGDFLDEIRINQQSASSSNKLSETNNKLSNLKGPLFNQNLKSINENSASSSSSRQAASFDVSQLDKDDNALVEANNTMRTFLSDLNLSPVDDIFEDKAQRRIVKESFAVEYCGRRKLRHLFLFNDVIVCAKYQASSKQKFTFDVKWYLNLNGISILDLSDANNQIKYDKEAIENQILAIRTSLMLLRGQMQHIKRSRHKQSSRSIKKLKKKRTELEAELVLLLPHLPLVIKHVNGKKYTFFLSSNFDRNQWIESIKYLQSQLPVNKGNSTSPSSNELQAWIQTCRKNLNPSLGTFLLRSNCEDDLLYGDLYINLICIRGITKPGNYYFCFEVDSYGHFSQKASSAVLKIENQEHNLSEEYVYPLDGAHTLRVLLYEDLGLSSKPTVVGKAHIELSRSWILDKPVEKVIEFNTSCSLSTQLSYSSSELLSMRVSHTKLCPNFGLDITQVCKKEKTNVPLLIQLCVNEVERRGMREVGIYRMSGTSTDIQRLKKAFETNPYVAEILLRDIDINSVTGFLKTYLREIPEGLFSNKLYLKFVAAFNIPQSEKLERTKSMLELFHKIPLANQHTILYLVEHLVKVNKFEIYNKMSLTNLATVLGPNILKPPTDSSSSNSSDPFTAVVIGSMSQAGILYFFLNRKYLNLPLTELDPSEMKPVLM